MLNITYYTFTDIIASMIMLLGLYKLSRVSPFFVKSAYAAAGFSVFALGELVFGVVDLFSSKDLTEAVRYVAMARSLVLVVFTVILLAGMRGICTKLDVAKQPLRCRTMTLWSLIVYGANIILQTTMLTDLIPAGASAVLYIADIVGMIIVVCANLRIIYGCYMYICMPEDLVKKPEKPSRFAFVNEYRRRQDEKQREEAAALRRKFEEKMQRRKKK